MYRVRAIDRSNGSHEFVSDLLLWDDVELVYFRIFALFDPVDFEIYIERVFVEV